MFLGVDGGGTKTAFCLIDIGGRVVGSALGGAGGYPAGNTTHLGQVLEDGVGLVCAQAEISPARIDYAFVGLPGYGEVSSFVPLLNALPYTILGHRRYTCDNDMVCAWAGSLATRDGINVISGTGSMTYGRCGDCGVRVGGWGRLFGDEGSAYWIAIRGLNAVSRMSDGRLPKGPLMETVWQRLELTADIELIDVVSNRWAGDRSKIAALARQVVEAAELGDAYAASIIADAGRELALLVETTRRRLGGVPKMIPVSYSGGTFASGRLLEAFRGALATLDGPYDLRSPMYPPVIGAALYAARLAGTPLGGIALERLRRERLSHGETQTTHVS